MSYQEVTQQGFFGRLSSAFGGIIAGIIMIAISVVMLFWNEGHYVHRAQGLAEGKKLVQSVSADKIDPALEGKLIHLSGPAKAGQEGLKDTQFGVHSQALRLKRQVSMYQWVEHKSSRKRKKMGGGEETVTDYNYEKEWSESHVSSSNFKQSGHTNPTSMPFQSATLNDPQATLGAFQLHDDVLSDLSNFSPLHLESYRGAEGFRLDNGLLYRGSNSANPQIGDLKVQFLVVQPGPISLVGAQQGGSLAPYVTKNGENILLVESGTHTAEEMFQTGARSNETFTWILRLVGWVLMCAGFAALFGPINVVADILPFIGDLVALGTGTFGCLIGSALTLVVIAVGWVFARPLVGILMLGGAIAVVVGAFRLGKGRRG